MKQSEFYILFCEHKKKLSEAWLKLTDKDLAVIDGNLERFLEKVGVLYQVPTPVILKELEAVRDNIAAGTEADFAPPLDPKE